MTRFLCLLGFHRPALPGDWNLGYCFSKCRHCDCDMVRSVLNGWKAPRAFRIVHGGPSTSYEDLDAFLRAREAPRPDVRTADRAVPPPAPLAASRVPPTAPPSRDGSPFDFSDFERAPDAPPPPLKNAQTG